MKSIMKFFKDLLEHIRTLIRNGRYLRENNIRAFYKIMIKFGIGMIFFANLFIPIFNIAYSDRVNHYNLFDLKGWFFYIVLFLSLAIYYLVLALNRKDKRADFVFTIHAIFTIIMVIYSMIIFFSEKDTSIGVYTLNVGFFTEIVIVAMMYMLAWREKMFLDFIYKTFKIPEYLEVEYVDKK